MKRIACLMLAILLLIPLFAQAETYGGREYVGLPELMTMEDGSPVDSSEKMAERREELLALFAQCMYGPIPDRDVEKSFELLEEGDTLDGAAIRRQIKITVSTAQGSCDALMLLVLPKANAPVPVVFGLSFGEVHTALADPEILPSYSMNKYPNIKEETRGTSASAWCIDEAVRRGYGIALASCNDFVPDNVRTYRKRLLSIFEKDTVFGMSGWALELECMADYLLSDPQVDGSRLAVVGTSRLGKAALWYGANDDRVPLVIPNVSGTCGAALTRSNTREQLADLNANFRWWMSSECKTYNDRIDELPVDQHELIACVAPRRVYLSSAETDTSNDSQGTWIALMLSRDAFRIYGREVIENAGPEQPAPGERIFTESMAYHMRTGNHGITPEDWAGYFDYMDEYLK